MSKWKVTPRHGRDIPLIWKAGIGLAATGILYLILLATGLK